MLLQVRGCGSTEQVPVSVREREDSMTLDEIIAAMEMNIRDDPEAQFVILVSNGGGICAHETGEKYTIKETITTWMSALGLTGE